MSQIRAVNPWRSMWNCPRKTVRALTQAKPTFTIFYIASFYALASLFFLANWWSLGLKIPFFSILLSAIFLSPFLGVLWLYLAGWLFYFTGRFFKGKSSMSHLRVAIAWSKIPAFLSLLIWLIFLIEQPEYVFIQDAGGISSLFVNFISLSLGIWSLVLLVQGVREVQKFSLYRSILNVAFASVLSSVIYLFLFCLFRYIYLTML